ncbi:membrane attack complex component/perforin (MACPF) domain-containing protein [Artemisia annua]|uniref:Membrane attack complex component/perforin (MACPF) domain-containing protein n=1 Tax=Artemisia annua TaxID=35608 RepID=A0A2U1KZP7_ARTAN|nr:membrane attack complex component/perforin (MACPF) domain-containing protein [Artemisia annua]
MNDTSNPAVVANTSSVVVNDRADSLDFNATQLGATTPAPSVQVNATNREVHVEPVLHASGRASSLKSKHDYINVLFGVSLETLEDIDEFTKGCEAGTNLVWAELESDVRTMAMEAVCGLSEAFMAETIAKSTTPKPTHESPIVQVVDIYANAPSYSGVTGSRDNNHPKIDTNFCPLVAEPVFTISYNPFHFRCLDAYIRNMLFLPNSPCQVVATSNCTNLFKLYKEFFEFYTLPNTITFSSIKIRFIHTYRTHIIVGMGVGGQDITSDNQKLASTVSPDLRGYLEDLGGCLFYDGASPSTP